MTIATARVNSLLYARTLADAMDVLYFKKDNLHRNIDNVTTIALGPSEGAFGFDPRLVKNSINLCVPCQDLYQGLLLYKYCLKKCDNLKTVILFFSLHTLGGNTLNAPSWRCWPPSYKKLFGGYDIPEAQNDRFREDYFLTESWKPKSEYPDMKGYYHLQRNFFKKYTTEEVINMAILYLRLGLNASSINIFYKIVRLSIENNINLFILFAPYRSDLIALLPSDIVIFYKLFKIMSYFKENYNSIFFHSFIRDSRFKDEFFGDSFHLTPGGPGSTMMTEMIASLLRGISCQ